MRHVDIDPQHKSGRLARIDVHPDKRYSVDPPQKPYHGSCKDFSGEFKRYLEGNSQTKYDREIDGRKQNLYDAEKNVYPNIHTGDFESLLETAEFVGDVIRRAWWQRRYLCRYVGLRPGYGATRGIQKSAAQIVLPKRVRNQWYVLHELIHITVPKPHAAHGRLFCARFLEIVRWHFGDEVGRQLKEAYQSNNVKHHPHHNPPENYA